MTCAIYIKSVVMNKYKRFVVSDEDSQKIFMDPESGLEFSFINRRCFARVYLLQDLEAVSPISELGLDSLLDPLQINKLVDALSQRYTILRP
ncbi:Formamidopyrimidine-DNA glycosylase [Dendrobium catenatum]|uniref:Formamidopyrimidine-DNA glycosylase n=1 Tax=Dendrobium catenatum TaxID=906689 RepID=A0A2I0X6A8_9ASPA|nr:Formamidopyrimidine-DNA glycosylase [Dendrobium catenatum]